MTNNEILSLLKEEFVFVCPCCGHVFTALKPAVTDFNSLGDYRDTYEKMRNSFVKYITKHLNEKNTLNSNNRR